MIVVPSIEPATIRAVRPGRRRALRTPSRKKTRLRIASTATTPSATDHGREEHDQDGLDREAEELAHDQAPERAASGASAIPTS